MSVLGRGEGEGEGCRLWACGWRLAGFGCSDLGGTSRGFGGSLEARLVYEGVSTQVQHLAYRFLGFRNIFYGFRNMFYFFDEGVGTQVQHLANSCSVERSLEGRCHELQPCDNTTNLPPDHPTALPRDKLVQV